MDRINNDVRSALSKIKQETKDTVEKITKESVKMAAKLLRDIDAGKARSKNDNALAAKKILLVSQQTTVELNERTQKSISRITEKATKAVSAVRHAIDSSIEDLVKIEKDAVERISKAGKDAAYKLSVSMGKGDHDKAESKKAKEAAEIIKNLGLAADRVKRGVKKATAQLKKAADEAVNSVRKAVTAEVKRVNDSINAANEKILQAATTAIQMTVGEKEATYFDMTALKDKWGNR
mgnify:CR=1 FL=1